MRCARQTVLAAARRSAPVVQRTPRVRHELSGRRGRRGQSEHQHRVGEKKERCSLEKECDVGRPMLRLGLGGVQHGILVLRFATALATARQAPRDREDAPPLENLVACVPFRRFRMCCF